MGSSIYMYIATRHLMICNKFLKSEQFQAGKILRHSVLNNRNAAIFSQKA